MWSWARISLKKAGQRYRDSSSSTNGNMVAIGGALATSSVVLVTVEACRRDGDHVRTKRRTTNALPGPEDACYLSDNDITSWPSFVAPTPLFVHAPLASNPLSPGAATLCDSAGFSGFLPRFSSVRRHSTQDKLRATANPGTLEGSYDVEWDKPIGQGTFGSVYMGTDRKTGEGVAIKKISKQAAGDESFQREMYALLHIREQGGHPNICGLRSHYDQGDHFYLVLDLVSGGEMFDHLCNHGPYSEADAARLVREVASALSFLHGLSKLFLVHFVSSRAFAGTIFFMHLTIPSLLLQTLFMVILSQKTVSNFHLSLDRTVSIEL